MNRFLWFLVGAAGMLVICACVAMVGAAGVALWFGSDPPELGAAATMTPNPPAPLATLTPPPVLTPTTRGTALLSTPSPTEPLATPSSTERPAQPNVDGALLGRAEQTLQAIEDTEIPQRDLFEIALRLGKIPPDTPRVVSESDPGYEIGDILIFTVANQITEENEQHEAALLAQTEHANWWVATDVTVDQDDLEESARFFEEQSYPTNRALFGSEWTPGVDGDPRVNVFLGRVAGVGGYYSSADEFPRSINPNSNEKEIFYININNAQPGDPYFDGILAHEFQHMIHWNNDRNEGSWVNEGLSELAAVANGLDYDGSVFIFAGEPDVSLTHWFEQTSPYYGSAFLFVRYYQQRFGDEAITELVQEQRDGSAAFDAVLADEGLSFDELFADWTIANLLDDPSVAEGQYDYVNDEASRPTMAEEVSRYPAAGEAEVFQYGTDYLRFEPDARGGTFTFEFEGERIVPLLPTEAYDGEWMMWGNRGDDSDTTLTRAFDLTELEEATLRYRLWYDLEPDYDYAYLMLSDDGGEQWQVIETDATTDENPHGNSFGPAYNALSGGGEGGPGGWIAQEVDLSAYAGEEVLVRFEVITDDALNQNGVVVDAVEIPELGYSTSFESGLDGWEPEGWVRVENLLPQHYIVQAVVEGEDGTVEVQPLALDEANRGELTVEAFGAEVRRITIAISGATPVTTERARYRFEAEVE